MEMLLGFLVLLACLIVGVRHGGIGLAVVSSIGLIVFTFVFGYKPGKPPVDVMLTIMAVVTCAGFLQTSGGLTVMLKYAEKFLRSNPKRITIYAPITTWLLTILCGTGHVVYTMFPIIYDIAIKEGIRPERPMAVASVASQMGISASPGFCCARRICRLFCLGWPAVHGSESAGCIDSGYLLRRYRGRTVELSPRQGSGR